MRCARRCWAAEAALALLLLAAPARAADPPLIEAQRDFDAAVAMWGGDTGRIDALLRRALELQIGELGADTLVVAHTQDRIGRNEFNRRHYAEAERMFRAAGATEARLMGERNLDVAYAYGSVGASLREQHSYQAAWPYVCRSLAIRRQLVPPGDPLIASSLDNLARIAIGEERYPEARALLEESHRLYLAAYGDRPALVRLQAQLLAWLRMRAPTAPDIDSLALCVDAPVS